MRRAISVADMNKDFIHKARGVSDLKCHLVLTPKYRRKIFDNTMLLRMEEVFKTLMEKWEGRLIEFNGEADHVHLLIQYTPQTQMSKLINNLKTVSSRYLRKEFESRVNEFYYKDVLWNSGYGVFSCGGVTVEQLKQYIETQDRPDK